VFNCTPLHQQRFCPLPLPPSNYTLLHYVTLANYLGMAGWKRPLHAYLQAGTKLSNDLLHFAHYLNLLRLYSECRTEHTTGYYVGAVCHITGFSAG
jgi:hypothetical protein